MIKFGMFLLLCQCPWITVLCNSLLMYAVGCASCVLRCVMVFYSGGPNIGLALSTMKIVIHVLLHLLGTELS